MNQDFPTLSPLDKLLYLTQDDPTGRKRAMLLLGVLDRAMRRPEWFEAADVEQDTVFETPLTGRAIRLLITSGLVRKYSIPAGNFFVRQNDGAV